jgi:hypothetical protein
VLEVKNQLDKDVSNSPVIEVGGERETSINSSAAASMTEFREVKSTADRVGLEVKSQLDKDRTHTNSEVEGGEKQLKEKWAAEFDKDRTHTNSEAQTLK